MDFFIKSPKIFPNQETLIFFMFNEVDFLNKLVSSLEEIQRGSDEAITWRRSITTHPQLIKL